MTTRTCEPRAGVAPRHTLGVTSRLPLVMHVKPQNFRGNAVYHPPLPQSHRKQELCRLPPQLGPALQAITHVYTHMHAHAHTCMRGGAERTQEGPTASPTPPCSPAWPTDRRLRPHPWRMCLWQMPRPLGRTVPQSQWEPLQPCSQMSHC